MQLQAKPAYWGIIDPKMLPGHGLKFEVSSVTGTKDARVFTITATNGDVGPAYATQITGFSLEQIEGRRCSPVVTPPSALPVSLGDLATSGTASASFTVNFAGCDDRARFAIVAPWSSSTYHTGTLRWPTEFRRDRW
jgi:endo-1,4-beta-xylanase